MFERKDFEKYMKDSEDYYDDREPMTVRKLYQLWKDGAEIGYCEGKEEAKKIIGNLYAICKDNHYPNCSVLMEQAEQFLKDIEGGRRMTDEEMAEEYCNNEVPFDTTENGEKLYTENDLKYAHLAGLKAGRTKWHKVADGDLPEYGVEVLDENGDKVRYEMEGYAGYSGQLPSLSGWIAYSEYEERDVEIDAPVAWCEVPQYTEELEKGNPKLLKLGTVEVDHVMEAFLRGR